MDVVSFDREWFATFNMAMVAFSATLVVHVNCFANSCRLVHRGGRYRWLRWLNLFQASCAVSCHLCRISDYFFPTDCDFKGFYNFVSYYCAVMSMDAMVAFMAAAILLTTVAHRERGIILCCFVAMVPFLAKLNIIVRAFRNIVTSVAPFNLCLSAFAIPTIFSEMMLTEVATHAFTLLVNGAILARYLNRNPAPFAPGRLLTLDLQDQGLLFMLFMDIATVCLYTPVGVGNAGPNPEILVQTRWAIVSKCFNIALIRFLRSRAEPPSRPLKSMDTRESNLPSYRRA